jgi:hypothetical protein
MKKTLWVSLAATCNRDWAKKAFTNFTIKLKVISCHEKCELILSDGYVLKRRQTAAVSALPQSLANLLVLPSSQTLHIYISYSGVILMIRFVLPRLQELKIWRHGSGMPSQQSVDLCWLAHAQNCNFDRMFSAGYSVPITNCAECMKKNFMYVAMK